MDTSSSVPERITIQEVSSKKHFRTFITLPAKIHVGHKNWVPPIYMDDRVFFNSAKNESFSHCDTVLALAYQGKKPVGRIMGIINHKYNEPHGLKEARFCFLETYDNYDIARELIAYIEAWACRKNMTSLVGPLGFSDKDPQGLLVDGLDEPNVIAQNCNLRYMVDFVEKAGFSKKTDLVVYKNIVPEVIPEFYQRIYERAKLNNPQLRLVNFTSRRMMKSYVRPVFTLMNETFKDIYAFAPLSEKEMDEFANRYIFLLDCQYLKVIENDKKEVVAFVLAMADISEGVKKCKGRLIPFGLIHVFLAKRRTTQLNLLLGGIKEEYRNSGLDTILGVSLMESARKHGMKIIDSHLELETNTKMRSEMEKMGGQVYKRYRIYQKELARSF